MESSVSLLDAGTTFLGALTTTFTPPATCLGTTAAVGSDGIPFQMFTGGVADADLIASGYLHTECYPPAYPATGGDNFGAYFSPGVCPAGYTTAATMIQGPETRAICCVTGLTANDLLNCQTSVTNSLLTASQHWTVASGGPYPIETGLKSGGSLLLIGSAIEIRYRAGSNPAPTIAPQTTRTTTSHDTYIPSNTGNGQTQTTLLLAASPTTTNSESFGGLSEGAKIGISVPVSLSVLAVVVVAVVVFSRRRRARLRVARASKS